MYIDKDFLKEKDACIEGTKWFNENFPEGGEYQAILDKLATENKRDWAIWLIERAGKNNTVLEVEEINCEASLFFAGRVIVKGAIKVAKWLITGGGIKAGRGIEAGWGIEAGSGIKAGGGIKAGWGIEAGSGIKAGGGIKAGSGIEAGGGIKAGRGIEAGDGIEAGSGIEAGGDYGIYAGLKIRISRKKEYAVIRAKEEPKNIVCGEFIINKEESKNV